MSLHRESVNAEVHGQRRDNGQQQQVHILLQQSKSSARTAISGLADQQEKQKGLRKQIIRARADYEELLEDGKQAWPQFANTVETLSMKAKACMSCFTACCRDFAITSLYGYSRSRISLRCSALHYVALACYLVRVT